MSSPDIAVDDGVLDAIVDRLQSAAAGLDSLTGTLPPVPDAGDATALVADLLADLLRRTGEIATGSGVARDLVAEGSAAYLETESAIVAHLAGGLQKSEA